MHRADADDDDRPVTRQTQAPQRASITEGSGCSGCTGCSGCKRRVGRPRLQQRQRAGQRAHCLQRVGRQTHLRQSNADERG